MTHKHGDIVVSPHGNDRNPGTIALPLATLMRARDLARERRGSGNAPLAICLTAGTHYLGETLVLTPQDSGLRSMEKPAPSSAEAYLCVCAGNPGEPASCVHA